MRRKKPLRESARPYSRRLGALNRKGRKVLKNTSKSAA
jgi:hypothetical protein